MRTLALLRAAEFFLFVSALLLVTVIFTSSAFADGYSARVVSVDGADTVQVDHNGRTETVKITGISCPQIVEPFGLKAREYAMKQLLGRSIVISVTETDTCGVVLGDVRVGGGKDYREEVVRVGLCRNASANPKIAAAQNEAQAARRGLWSKNTPRRNPPPKRQPPPRPQKQTQPQPPPPPPSDPAVVADKRSREYYLPGCPQYNQVPPQDRIVFRSIVDAINAGFDRGGMCH